MMLTKKMSEGVHKVFGDKFLSFCESMLVAADHEDLPIQFNFEAASILTCKDIEGIMSDFKRITGLEITGNFFMCNECEKIHITFEVDYPYQETETVKTFIQ